ncbi:MAG: hypothetical protein H6562_22555 [Lewinellaceae bacterium]|nr:hypothetical protein [Lewinellaceae bacterium]
MPVNVATAHLLMPETSPAVFVVHSTRIFPDFPHNERSKNERPPLLNFAFFLLHFAFDLCLCPCHFLLRPKESNQRKGTGRRICA